MSTEVKVRKSNRGRKPKPGGPKRGTVTVRCEIAYREWLGRFAKAVGTTPSKLVDQGLAEMARLKGFDPPPKR